MKVFLGNAPWKKGNRLGIRAGSRWPFTVESSDKVPGYLPFPFFLAYAAAVLEKNGIEVSLVDGIAEGIDTTGFIDKIKQFGADIVLLETSTPSLSVDLSTAREIKEACGCLVALSGPHVSAMFVDVMKNNFIDFILYGEYEYTLLDLAEHLSKNKSLDDIKGLVYRKGADIKVNERRPLIENLDELPWPARHFLPMYNYNDEFAGMKKPNTQIWASRGCPYGCIFCLWPKVMYGSRKYRVRDPKKVVDEMEWLIGEYKFKSIYFDDDTFNIGKDRVIAFASEIKARGIDVPWSVMASATPMDRDMLVAMKSAGLVSLKYGVESGDQAIVDGIHKGLNLDKLKAMVKETKELGINVHLTFTFGLPGETWDSVRKTIDFAVAQDPDSLQFSICTPFPGTDYFDIADGQGFISTKDWDMYDGGCNAIIRTEHMTSQELTQAWKTANETWERHLLRRRLRNDPFGSAFRGLKHPGRSIHELAKLMKR